MKFLKRLSSVMLLLLSFYSAYGMNNNSAITRRVKEGSKSLVPAIAAHVLIKTTSMLYNNFFKSNSPEKMSLLSEEQRVEMEEHFLTKKELKDLTEKAIFKKNNMTEQEALKDYLQGCYVSSQVLEEKNYITKEELKENIEKLALKKYVTDRLYQLQAQIDNISYDKANNSLSLSSLKQAVEELKNKSFNDNTLDTDEHAFDSEVVDQENMIGSFVVMNTNNNKIESPVRKKEIKDFLNFDSNSGGDFLE